MKPARWLRASIRRALLVVLIPGMLLVFSAELWLAWRTASEAADAAYDRSLLGAVKSIDSSISTASGGLGVELPYRMLEFFELTAQGKVYYRVATEDGLVEIGSPELPPPPEPLRTGVPQFFDGAYLGEAVRVVSAFHNVAAHKLATDEDIACDVLVFGDDKADRAQVVALDRDETGLEAAMAHPHYGWERNKGYGTAEHMEALRVHGATPLHRRSFAPVAQLSLI